MISNGSMKGFQPMTLGQRIKQLRKERGWTQRELEQRAGLENRNLTRYESDKVRPRLESLTKIAEALEVSVDELTREEPSHQFQDKELLNQFLAVEKMDEKDRFAIKRILQAMIVKSKVQNLQVSTL